jgi:hypothetical protein
MCIVRPGRPLYLKVALKERMKRIEIMLLALFVQTESLERLKNDRSYYKPGSSIIMAKNRFMSLNICTPIRQIINLSSVCTLVLQ